MRRRTKLALAVPALALAGFGAALVYYSRKWIAPPRVVFEPPAEEHAEPVRFGATDGLPLAGWLLRGRAEMPAIILCHGYQRCMEEPFALAVELHERGFTTLLFDFRGCGRSGGRYTTIGDLEPRDVIGAARWLRARLGPATPIGVHGISMGGSAAISAAAQCPEIGAVVADSAFAHLSGAVEYRFSGMRPATRLLHQATMRIAERMSGGRVARVRPVDVVGRLGPRPLLLIHGTDDRVVPYGHLGELAAAAGEACATWTLPAGSHAMSRFDHDEAYVERVAAFFITSLGREPASARPEPAATLALV